VECHPYLNQRKLLDFCKSKDIVLVAYSALGGQLINKRADQSIPVLLDDPVLCAMAEKHQRTPALVALRYQLQRGLVVLAQSFNEKHIRENLQVFEFQLSSEDMKVLDGLNRNFRYVNILMTTLIYFLMNIDMDDFYQSPCMWTVTQWASQMLATGHVTSV
ncbi:PREDICTED: aldo-keto reductase family 1 member C1 homolog, partial [Galeopterus variegatus]|uniref:Aldo-keto reductase family 1 member C1 homolog n=1 Tax=Galeopterus variegatus TaxID=482537 RepID=A0ABM0PZG8_GALVR